MIRIDKIHIAGHLRLTHWEDFHLNSTYWIWVIYLYLLVPICFELVSLTSKTFKKIGMDSSRFVPSIRVLCRTCSIAGCVNHCHVGLRNIFCILHDISFGHHSETQNAQEAWNPLTSFEVLVRLLGGFVDSCHWSELVLHSLMLGI